MFQSDYQYRLYFIMEIKGLSAESIKPSQTSDNSFTPIVSYYGNKTRVKFTGSCLKQPKSSKY